MTKESVGSDPNPDTHTISFKLNYQITDEEGNKEYQEPINVEVSIFPAFTSMLLGTLSGGFLGTMASHNFNFKWNDLLSTDLLSKLVISLMFSFIAGVVICNRLWRNPRFTELFTLPFPESDRDSKCYIISRLEI